MNKFKPRTSSRPQGFSIIELLIVVAIIGVLSGIAYPMYSQHTREVRRSDAWVALIGAGAAQERWYSVNHAYTNSMDNLLGSSSPEAYYTLSVEAENSSFTLTATARTDGAQSTDTECAEMTLDHLGTQLPAKCWD